MTRRLLAALVTIPLLAGCGADAATPPPPADPPADGPVGDYVSDGLPDPFDDGDVLRVTFGDGEIRFQATCNTMSGLAEWDDGVLRVSHVGGTEMGCSGAGHEQDEWLIEFFTSSPSVTVDGTDVRLKTGDAKIWLVPADEVDPDPGPDAALEGTRWGLTGIEEADGDDVGIMIVRKRFGSTLRIRDGRLVAYTGCNTMGGKVVIRDEWLRVKRPSTTLVGCHGVRAGIEQAIHDVIRAGAKVQWSVNGQGLRLTRRDTSLLFRAR